MRMIGIVLTLSLSWLAAQAVAGEACGAAACNRSGCGSANKCAQCGCECCCQQRTCQLICGMEKVKKYCFEVKCEEFCPLLPGHCEECKNCNEPCEKCQAACKGGEKCPNPTIRTPRTANARVKKTLVKKEYECQRPKYKTVVQYLCPQCAAACTTTLAPAPAEGAKPLTPTPAPPKTTYDTPLPPIASDIVTK